MCAKDMKKQVMRMLKVRLMTAAFLCAATVIALVFSHIPYVTNIIVMVISAASIYELYRAAGALGNRRMLMCSWGLNLLMCMLPMAWYTEVVAAVFVGMILLCIKYMKGVAKYSFSGAYQALFASSIISLFMRSIVDLRELDGGLGYVVFAVLVCVITDSAAYLVGRRYGKRKLAVMISPNKTVEGGLAGVVSVVVIMTVFAAIAEQRWNMRVPFEVYIVYLAIASVVAQFGDLAFSTIKRMAGIKDYGDFLPGHGGILDRIDSVVFVMPFTLIYVYLIRLLPIR